MTIDEMIEVMQAYRDGAKIETKSKNGPSVWTEVDNPLWEWCSQYYRAKKEPVRVRLYRYNKSYPWNIVNEAYGVNPDVEVITVEQVDG